jgi:hypothetical protein
MFVDAGVLAKRYATHAARADDLFQGRAINLSGRLERIGENYVSVRAAELSVRCTLGRAATAEERALLPGTPVMLRGAVHGMPEKGRIDLRACELLAEPRT